jgi:hypothetical protein
MAQAACIEAGVVPKGKQEALPAVVYETKALFLHQSDAPADRFRCQSSFARIQNATAVVQP